MGDLCKTNIHIQTEKSYLLTVDNYFPSDYADKLFEKCKKLDLIVEPQMKMGTAHRCMNFYSNESKGYYFSSQLMVAQPLPDYLLEFMNIVNKALGSQFNGLLVNYYRDGEDSIGSHADAEKDLYNGKVVAYTLMNPSGNRIFRLRDILARLLSNGKLYFDVQTRHNQLLIMGGEFQKEFKHEVPVEKRNLNAERCSITLRYHKN